MFFSLNFLDYTMFFLFLKRNISLNLNKGLHLTKYHFIFHFKINALEDRKINLMTSLKEEFGRIFMLSFGVFLFILFFQPFPLGMLDYNDRLIYVTGFGVIEFVFACLVLVIVPMIVPKWFMVGEWESGPPLLLSLTLILITSTAFSFYIRFVGKVPLTFYIVFKVVLVCLLPILSLIFLYKNKSLENIIIILKEQNKNLKQKVRTFEDKVNDEIIKIETSNKSEQFVLKHKDIIAVKSADNYIEVFYLINDSVEKKLLRNTLKSVESQLADHSDFIRCHRTSLVNTAHIVKLARNYSGYYLKMKYLEEIIPVSRQYLEQVRASLTVPI